MHDGAKPDLFKNAGRLRASMTEPELKLWEYLKKKPHGFKFRRQHPIGVYILTGLPPRTSDGTEGLVCRPFM